MSLLGQEDRVQCGYAEYSEVMHPAEQAERTTSKLQRSSCTLVVETGNWILGFEKLHLLEHGYAAEDCYF